MIYNFLFISFFLPILCLDTKDISNEISNISQNCNYNTYFDYNCNKIYTPKIIYEDYQPHLQIEIEDKKNLFNIKEKLKNINTERKTTTYIIISSHKKVDYSFFLGFLIGTFSNIIFLFLKIPIKNIYLFFKYNK